jgi:hypothetical protein
LKILEKLEQDPQLRVKPQILKDYSSQDFDPKFSIQFSMYFHPKKMEK